MRRFDQSAKTKSEKFCIRTKQEGQEHSRLLDEYESGAVINLVQRLIKVQSLEGKKMRSRQGEKANCVNRFLILYRKVVVAILRVDRNRAHPAYCARQRSNV